MKSNWALILFSGIFLAATPAAISGTWTQSAAPTESWGGVAVSADGSRMMAVSSAGIYWSTNSGSAWTPCNGTGGHQWQSIAASADGGFWVAADASGGGIFTSTDFGQTWTSNSVPNENWWSVAASSGGTKLAAAVGIGGGPIFRSTDSGATWSPLDAPATNYWASIASSADGTKLAAAQLGDNSFPVNYGGYVYISTNSGATWNRSAAPFSTWESIASSADGTHLIAVSRGTDGGVYTSADFGNTWVSNSLPSMNWSAVSASADGRVLLAAASSFLGSSPSLFCSTDAGATWVSEQAADTNWQCVAISADGSIKAGVVNNGGIYLARATPSPRLNLVKNQTQLLLSWIVSSTNFDLEERTDLTAGAWNPLTNTPVLDLTNLMYQERMVRTNADDFFRLTTE